jgi:hypothetical protein
MRTDIPLGAQTPSWREGLLEFCFSVYPEPSSIRAGGPFSLRIVGLPFREEVTHVSVDLARVQWEETSWWWNSGAKPVGEGDTCTLSFKQLDVPPGIYAVSRLRFSLGPEQRQANTIDARPGKNFPRAFVQVIDEFVQPAAPDEIADRVRVVEEARERLFLRGIVADPTNPGIGRFRGFALVTRCLLTRRMRLGQLEVFPLKRGLRSAEPAVIMNQVLADSGFPPIIEPGGQWARVSQEAFPLMVIHMPVVYARGHDEAMAAIERYSSAVIDVLSPNRISYGEVLVFALQSLDFPNLAWYRPAFEGYRGNLAGGPISGEQPTTVKNDLLRVLADPMLQLFVSLYREAAAESNVDFAYFRFWNLLEAIATRRVQVGQKHNITTFEGQPILGARGKPVNTTSDTARVYQLIKSHFQARGLKHDFLLAPLKIRDLWDVCHVWSGYRNATAHYGGFVLGDAHQSQRPWYALTSQAYVEVTANGDARGGFSDAYFWALSETARLIVVWEIRNPRSESDTTEAR